MAQTAEIVNQARAPSISVESSHSASTQVAHSHSTNVARATMTHQTTVKEETVAMMVARTTIAAGTTATITAITTVVELIQMAIGIAVMAITISAITSVDAICALASIKEPTIEHPTKAIAVWSMTLPTVHRV